MGDIIKNQEHLPLYGVGPYLVAPMLFVSLLGLILSYYNLIPVYKFDSLYWLFVGLAIVLILDGIFLWLAAVKLSKITDKIENNELVTDGVYALVRHPLYSAWLQFATALILLSQNVYLLILPIIFWAALSLALKKTEEKWLLDKFGDEYVNYCHRTNRFIPFKKSF